MLLLENFFLKFVVASFLSRVLSAFVCYKKAGYAHMLREAPTYTKTVSGTRIHLKYISLSLFNKIQLFWFLSVAVGPALRTLLLRVFAVFF